MELLYIYFSETGNMMPANLNFGGSHLFQYSTQAKQISITLNPYYVKDFFQTKGNSEESIAQLLNISAIVGENGAGKSSTLNNIIQVLENTGVGLKSKIIVAIKKNEEVIVYHTKGLLSKVPAEQAAFGCRFEQLNIKESQPHLPLGGLIIQEFPVIPGLDKLDIVFFSNIFDLAVESSGTHLRNISTNFLSERRKEVPDLNKLLNSEASDKEEFRFREIRGQIDLLSSLKADILPFTTPEQLIVEIRYDYVERYVFDKDGNLLTDPNSYDFYYSIYKVFSEELSTLKDIKKKIKLQFLGAAMFNFLSEFIHQYDGYGPFVNSAIERMNENEWSFTELIEHLTTNFALEDMNLMKDVANEGFEQHFLNTKAGKMLAYMTFVKKMEFTNNHVGDGDGKVIVFNMLKEVESFYSFYQLYRESYLDRPYLNFTWRNLSSGERALFSIYARFYSLSDQMLKSGNPLKEHVLILMDEPDLYLHPAWQKQLMENLRKFIPVIYSSDKQAPRTVQLVMTSNNPLTISDLPHTNIVFLRKDGDKSVVQDSLEQGKRTFAANIFDLYADSFFLQDGFTGDFAVRIINEIFDELRGTEVLSEERKTEIKKIIQMIGEPILKNRLVEMYHIKEQIDNSFDQRLKRIENKLFGDDHD
ncbi:AAA family ATPase [Pedobacter jeongneungensis]|uniref:AAA family ATPase n=1 Tax=Pedobacter jeongneungensis TaxID=947309 RepID=UPI0004A820F2|nr:AAA family ATPase [Pedobacter jeongneungensis]